MRRLSSSMKERMPQIKEVQSIMAKTSDHKDKKPEAGSSSQKRTLEDSKSGEKSPRKKQRAMQPWTPEEEQTLVKSAMKIAMANIATIQQNEELRRRDGSKIKMKLRGLAKNLDKQFGGTGEWVDAYVSRRKTDEQEDE